MKQIHVWNSTKLQFRNPLGKTDINKYAWILFPIQEMIFSKLKLTVLKTQKNSSMNSRNSITNAIKHHTQCFTHSLQKKTVAMSAIAFEWCDHLLHRSLTQMMNKNKHDKLLIALCTMYAKYDTCNTLCIVCRIWLGVKIKINEQKTLWACWVAVMRWFFFAQQHTILWNLFQF